MIGFEVYTGKDTSEAVKHSEPFDPKCNKTTKLVVGLLQKLDLLDLGFNLYVDNFYQSPELCQELFARDTYCCGTVRKDRVGFSVAVKEAKLKPGECVFRRNDYLLALKYCDKRPVSFLSTIHEAVEVATSKRDKQGNVIIRPLLVRDYVKYMRGCDVCDQLVSQYTLLRRSIKWWRKLLFHFFMLTLNNAYILHRKFGAKKIAHEEFLEYIAKYLISSALPTATCIPKRYRGASHTSHESETRLVEKHYPSHFPSNGPGNKRVRPSKLCHACNFGKKDSKKLGYNGGKMPRKMTSVQCVDCDKPLCIDPCFRVYHSELNYRAVLMKHRREEN